MAADDTSQERRAAESSEPAGRSTGRDVGHVPEDEAPVFRGTGVSAALIIGVALAVLAIVLTLQNTENTTVEVFEADYRAPLVVIILAAGIAGVIIDEIVGFFWRRRRRRQLAERAELRRFRRSRSTSAPSR